MLASDCRVSSECCYVEQARLHLKWVSGLAMSSSLSPVTICVNIPLRCIQWCSTQRLWRFDAVIMIVVIDCFPALGGARCEQVERRWLADGRWFVSYSIESTSVRATFVQLRVINVRQFKTHQIPLVSWVCLLVTEFQFDQLFQNLTNDNSVTNIAIRPIALKLKRNRMNMVSVNIIIREMYEMCALFFGAMH